MALDNGHAIPPPSLDELAAEVRHVRDTATRADAVASEAIRRVAEVRADVDALEDRVDARLSEVHTWIGELDARLGRRFDAIEANSEAHRKAVVQHLEKLWGAALDLRSNDADLGARTDAMGRRLALLYALLTILGLLVQRLGGM